MCITTNNPSEPCCDSPLQRCKACPTLDWRAFTWRYEQPSADRGLYIPYHTTSPWYQAKYGAGDGSPIARFEATSFLMVYDGYCTWANGPVRSIRPESLGNAVLPDTDEYPHFHAPVAYVQNNLVAGRPTWIPPFGPLGLIAPGQPVPADMYTLESGVWNCTGANRWIRNDANSPWTYPDVYPAWITLTRVRGQGVLSPFGFINEDPESP